MPPRAWRRERCRDVLARLRGTRPHRGRPARSRGHRGHPWRPDPRRCRRGVGARRCGDPAHGGGQRIDHDRSTPARAVRRRRGVTPTRVTSLLVHRARVHPDGIAFIEASTGERLTWRELALHAERWKRLAAARGLRPGHRAGLVVDAPLAFAGGYLSALAAGMTVVPLDPRAPLADLTRALARMRVDVVVSDRADVLEPSTPLETWCAAHDGPMARDGMASHNRPSDAAIVRPAVLLSSSGTTGAPKGIPLDETLLLDAAARIVRHHRLRSADRGYTPLPLFHVNAQVVGLLSTLLSGGAPAPHPPFPRAEVSRRVAAGAPTRATTGP